MRRKLITCFLFFKGLLHKMLNLTFTFSLYHLQQQFLKRQHNHHHHYPHNHNLCVHIYRFLCHRHNSKVEREITIQVHNCLFTNLSWLIAILTNTVIVFLKVHSRFSQLNLLTVQCIFKWKRERKWKCIWIIDELGPAGAGPRLIDFLTKNTRNIGLECVSSSLTPLIVIIVWRTCWS